MAWRTWIMIATVHCALIFASVVQAASQHEDLKELYTVAGKLKINRSIDGREVTLAGKPIIKDDYTTILGFEPKNSPEFVLLHLWTGGNRCCFDTKLLRIRSSGEVEISDPIPLDKSEINTGIENGNFFVEGNSEYDGDLYGDPIKLKFVYDKEKSSIFIDGPGNSVEYLSFVGKYPFTLFADKSARSPLVRILGAKFREFREAGDRAGPLKLIKYRYLVGHSVNSTGWNYFVIDLADESAFAAWLSETGVLTAGRRYSDPGVEENFREILNPRPVRPTVSEKNSATRPADFSAKKSAEVQPKRQSKVPPSMSDSGNTKFGLDEFRPACRSLRFKGMAGGNPHHLIEGLSFPDPFDIAARAPLKCARNWAGAYACTGLVIKNNHPGIVFSWLKDFVGIYSPIDLVGGRKDVQLWILRKDMKCMDNDTPTADALDNLQDILNGRVKYK